MKIFTRQEIENSLPEWEYRDHYIIREFTFRDFKEAFAFMVKVAFWAEIMDHHPNWSNVYNKVSVKLYTHTLGEVTEKDVDLAREINKLIH
jgi:4a-hydroxytetrahydrobiopterin dehydratase